MRLIDADELLKDPLFLLAVDNYGIDQIIEAMPTVEAEPIRHGEWLMDDESGDLKCSRCGHWSYDMYDEHMVIDGKIGVAAINPHYCGYCGAKMDDAEVQI